MIPKLIVAMCVYNEEQFIEMSIDSVLHTIKDVDVIEIQDGAWKMGGDTTKSTDRTKEIVTKLQEKYNNRCDIEFREAEQIFDSEPHKRNHQLQFIQDLYGAEPYWVMVLDADEIVAFNSGLYEIWVKDYLGNMPFAGMLTAYAIGSDKPMYGPRFIPGGQGYHYHTEKSMIMHNKDCKLEIDYNVENQNVIKRCADSDNPLMVFHIKPFFLINFWPKRPTERMLDKKRYRQFQDSQQTGNSQCRYLSQEISKTVEKFNHVQN
jgi:glycosyltransferase involved in cell wall biosynthesis